MKTCLLSFFVLIQTLALAQTKISGIVTDEKGEVIPGANVSIVGAYDGASTNEEGKFQFTTQEKGALVLAVSFIGYKPYQQSITANGNPIQVTIILKESINELEAVVITAGSFNASDESRRTVFKALDIATTAGATADIAGALNTLPGTQKVGESGRLFVRGGDGTETRTFIDGMLVLDAYGAAAPNTPSRGRFLPFMFKGTSFSTGGYSAEYGQALSSALVLDSKDTESITRTDIGLLSVGADVAHTQVWNKASLAGKIQYTNIRPYFGLINQEIEWDKAPLSYEGSAAFRQQVGKTGLLKVFGNFNQSDFSLFEKDILDENQRTRFQLNNGYRYINTAYKQAISKNWNMRSGTSFTHIKNDIGIGEIKVDEVDKGIHTKWVAEGSLSDAAEMVLGAEWINHSYNVKVDTSVYSLQFKEDVLASFAESQYYISNNFVIKTGVRAEYNSLLNKVAVDPRFSLAFKPGKEGQFSFAYGRFRQSPRNEYVRINSTLQQELSSHYILSYQLVENSRTFRAEVYYKEYENLVTQNQVTQRLANDGAGYAKGFEFFWRDNRSIERLDYWLSYSYLDTKRKQGNFPEQVMPSFASAHNFSIVGKYYFVVLKSQVGLTYSYTSGRPYHNPNENKFMNGRTPYYSDLSFNWSYLPKPNIIVHFSCTNVLGRDNIFGYQFSNQPNNEGIYVSRPIRQAAPRFIFLGVFITLSKDKVNNQLPSL